MTGDPTECPLRSAPAAAAHLLGASAGKARQTRRSLLGCVHGNIALWSGSGGGRFVYPALVRRSLNGTHRRTSTALFFGGPTPFLLALSKEMGSGKVRFQRRSLWTPRSARLDLKWLRGPDPCFGRQKKWFLENSAQGRQPLDSGSRASAPNLPVGSLTPKHQHRAQPRQYKIPNVECSEHNRVRQQYRRRGQHRQ